MPETLLILYTAIFYFRLKLTRNILTALIMFFFFSFPSFLSAVTLCFILTKAEERLGPQFITLPPSRMDFANTKGGILSCAVHGNPIPTIQWLYADGRTVQTIPGLRTIDSNGTLIFPPFSSDNFHKDLHAVEYKCVARNRVGAIVSPNIRVNAGKLKQRTFYDSVPLVTAVVLVCSS